MSLKRSLYILLVIAGAGISALIGALFGPTGDQMLSGTGFFISGQIALNVVRGNETMQVEAALGETQPG